MIFKKCPGQDLSRKKPGDVVYNLPCPHCGYEVEFFFDDKFRICPRCKTNIKKSDKRLLKDFGCASWCIAAEECLGPKLYARFNEAKGRLVEEKKTHLNELLNSIPEDEIEVKDFFRQAFHENTDFELLINPEKSIKPLEKNNPKLYKKVIKDYSEYSKYRQDKGARQRFAGKTKPYRAARQKSSK